MFKVTQPYRPRPTRFLRLQEHDGWRLKVYSIVYGEMDLDHPTYDEGLALALDDLPEDAVTESRPGVGFVIFHQGRGVHYLVLAWWDNENELPLRVFVRGSDEPSIWREARGAESICVWDLQVIDFERDAYIKAILSGGPPDIDAYLAQRFES